MNVLSYNFEEIDAIVSQDIQLTSARLNSALEDLRRQITPLTQVWTREAAAGYQLEQARWQQAAEGLHDILVRLGNAVADGAADIASTDRRAARAWG